MSTFAYGALQSNREDAPVGTSTSTSPPGLSYFVDAIAALVPSEVLAIHAAIVAITTETTTNPDGQAVTTITSPEQLKWFFYIGIVLSVVFYLVSHLNKGIKSHWHRWDIARMLIPPAAFIFWTMAQKSTAFDAMFPHVDQVTRSLIVVLGAVMLGLLTGVLAKVADQSVNQPTPE